MKLLLVDDEKRIHEMVSDGMREDGFEVVPFTSAEEAMLVLAKSKDGFDAFLVDVMLPGLNGIDFCRWLRDRGHREPMVMLTARSGVEDKVAGLDAGADDYLVKPFQIAELRARFRALFRKINGYPRATLVVGDLSLDPNAHTVSRRGVVVSVSEKEQRLLEYLMQNHSSLVTRAMIAGAIWDTDATRYTNVIDVFVNHLRKKIDLPGYPRLLHTVRGKGFRLALDEEPQD